MEKKFIIPESIIVLFSNDDIITKSGFGDDYGQPGDDGSGEYNGD